MNHVRNTISVRQLNFTSSRDILVTEADSSLQTFCVLGPKPHPFFSRIENVYFFTVGGIYSFIASGNADWVGGYCQYDH